MYLGISYRFMQNINSLDFVTVTQKLNLDFVPETCQEYTLNKINQTFTEEAFNMIISEGNYHNTLCNPPLK